MHARDRLDALVQVLATDLPSKLLLLNQRFDGIYSVHLMNVKIAGGPLVPQSEAPTAFHVKQGGLAVQILLRHEKGLIFEEHDFARATCAL